MTKNQIRNFVKKNSPVHIPLTFKKIIRKNGTIYIGWCDGKSITIGMNEFNKNKSNSEQKSILLHEIGHILCPSKHSGTKPEYEAHRWAIEYTRKNKLKKIEQYLIKDVWNWICYYKWNSIHRRYLMAGLKLLENGIV